MLMSMMLVTAGLFAQHAEVVERYDDGAIKTEYSVVNADLVSVIHFYPTGATKEKGFFKNDVPEGQWESFSPNGEKVYELSYKDGKRHGEFRAWDLYSNTYTEIYYRDGEVIKADKYKKEDNLATISK